jgi:DNA-binding Lrp family transcriptional regulator
MTNQIDVLSQVFDDKTVKILEKILQKDNVIYIRELAKETGVSLATTFRIVQHFLELGIIEKKTQGKFNFYNVKKNAPIFKELRAIILNKTIGPIDILKREIPEKKIFQNNKNSKEFFVVSNEELNTKEIVSKVKEETNIVIKINVLNESLTT